MNDGGRRFWVSLVAGSAVMGYGVWVALDDAAATHPSDLLVWIVGADALHDLVLAPLACIVGALLTRFVPEPWRTPLRSGLIVSAIVVVVSWPAWRGYGRDRVPDNESALPLDYTTGILTVLAAVWAGALLWAFIRATRRRSTEE